MRIYESRSGRPNVMEEVKEVIRREWEDKEDDRTTGGFGPKRIQKEV